MQGWDPVQSDGTQQVVALQQDVETPGVHQEAWQNPVVAMSLNTHKESIYDWHQKPPVVSRRNNNTKYIEGIGRDHLTKNICMHGVGAQVPTQVKLLITSQQ